MTVSRWLAASAAIAFTCGNAYAQSLKDEYQDLEHAELLPYVSSDSNSFARAASSYAPGSAVFVGFEGVSQYDVASYGRNFIPPDTMGAVGSTQYTSFVNGGFGVFDKATGAAVMKISDVAFWAGAGRTGTNGDSRVMFDNTTQRWVALSFANSVSQIQIAVSDSANAAGTWHSTVFTGYAGGTADYPTMALDSHALYIGTNDYGPAASAACGGVSFCGTTLNVLPLASLFAAGGPNTTGLTQFYHAYTGTAADMDRGFAIQGVNTSASGTTGQVIAASLFSNDTIRYDVNFTGGVATSEGTVQYLGTADYDGNGPGRQPNQVPDANPNSTFANNNRVIDTLDSRISSAVFEKNGKIYSVYTATPVGGDYTYVRYTVVDATTHAVLDQGQIGDGQHDFYQGSIAVNDAGQVVIAYNRSGSNAADGNITFAAERFITNADGTLSRVGDELVLKVSLVDDYHNGTVDGQVASGRQRWGDYSAVNVDPTDQSKFWAIGEWAREYNDAAGGHPGGTGGSRWSTWISGIDFAAGVPEPSSWAMMIAGFAFVGGAMRRRGAVKPERANV